MTDFLLELRSEEIPARMQLKAKDDLVRLFTDALAKAGLAASNIEAFATPRRLALIAKGLPLETAASSEETKGPKIGAPPQAMEGFLRKVGLTQDQLIERDGVYFAIAEKPGRKTADVLAEAIPAIIRAFPWPKSQRWGAASVSTESLRWVRPLQGIVALLGDDVVACEIDGIVSGRATMGHRFHSTGPVEIANADGYVEALRAAHVIVHFSERTKIIRDGAEAAAKTAGLVLVPDEGLVTENAGLTEWPVPMLGRFDPAFLAVPQEVIQLTARVNQKYFVCNDAGGKLANAFVCTANINAHDGGAAIVAGNEKVLAARLSDAKFFWEQDLKVALDEQAKKLSQITFHEKLGTVADKSFRIAILARHLVASGFVPSNEGDNKLADLADRAGCLCKADLVTGMVGEFPELQGIMGGYYARAQGEQDSIADAIRDHYKPLGQGDDVPVAPVTVAVSLADKIDTLATFFYENLLPTGSKDPFALRRAALGSIQLIVNNNLRVPLIKTFFASMKMHGARLQSMELQTRADLLAAIEENFVDLDVNNAKDLMHYLQIEKQRLVAAGSPENVSNAVINEGDFKLFSLVAADRLLNFFADRLKVQQREAGVRHDLIDAVFALGGEDDLVRLLRRVKALQAFVATQEGADLLAGYKRAANILKSSPSLLGEGDHPKDGGGAASAAGALSSAAPPSSASAKAPADATSPSKLGEDLSEAERDLLTALNTAEPLASAAIEAEQFEDAMAALASLRAPIDAFFDGVMVNDPDPEKRAFRVGLLTRFRDAVHRVADFSRIEG